MVKILDEAPAMHFLGVLSHTKVSRARFYKLVWPCLGCLIARARTPNGVEDFLNTYIQKLLYAEQRQHSARYQKSNTSSVNATKPSAKLAHHVNLSREGPASPPPST